MHRINLLREPEAVYVLDQDFTITMKPDTIDLGGCHVYGPITVEPGVRIIFSRHTIFYPGTEIRFPYQKGPIPAGSWRL